MNAKNAHRRTEWKNRKKKTFMSDVCCRRCRFCILFFREGRKHFSLSIFFHLTHWETMMRENSNVHCLQLKWICKNSFYFAFISASHFPSLLVWLFPTAYVQKERTKWMNRQQANIETKENCVALMIRHNHFYIRSANDRFAKMIIAFCICTKFRLMFFSAFVRFTVYFLSLIFFFRCSLLLIHGCFSILWLVIRLFLHRRQIIINQWIVNFITFVNFIHWIVFHFDEMPKDENRTYFFPVWPLSMKGGIDVYRSKWNAKKDKRNIEIKYVYLIMRRWGLRSSSVRSFSFSDYFCFI